ncbi:MAG: lysylphosphatidylglycerol synthase domain-containing protein [Micromonosporaceae bacterium]
MRTSRRAELVMGRSPRDIARLVLSAVVVIVAALAASHHGVDPIEAAIFRDLAALPAWTEPVSRFLTLLGSVAAVGVAAGIALFARKWRLAAEFVAGGTLAWLAATLLHAVVPARVVALDGRTVTITFPSDAMTIAAVLATVASPYLPRPVRRILPVLLALIAVAENYTGRHLPLDIVAGAFLGWGIGILLHLVLGAPGRSSPTDAVQRALHQAGLDAETTVPLRSRLFGPMLFEAVTASGSTLLVEVVRRGQRRAGWTYKARRLLASLEVEDEPRLTSPYHEVDHEAFVTLLAERSGVRTPTVMLAGELGHGLALIVRSTVLGRRLSELTGTELDDDLLDEIWRQVAVMGAARIAHHDLRAVNVLVDGKGDPWIVDFTFARAGASTQRLAQDVAEMLVSLASVAGVERAIGSAMRVIPEKDLRAAVTYLQPLALPARIRQQLGSEGRPLLSELSAAFAHRVGEPRPSFRPRIRATTVLTLAVGGGAVYLLLPQIAAVPRLVDTIRYADYWWLAAAFWVGALTFPMAAASYAGAVHRAIPFGRTTLVQVASAFTSRLTPGGVGGMGLNMIYLERLETSRTEAIGSIALNQAAGAVVHAILFFIAAVVLGTGGFIGNVTLPHGWLVLVVVVVVLVAAGVFLGTPFGRGRVLEPGLHVGRKLVGVLRQPGKALMLFGGSTGVTLANALALAASLAAFWHGFSVLSVMAVYVGGSALASAAPTPGNLGAVEAALVAGLTGIRVPPEQAVAAVLSFRLLTFWLPILPGAAVFRYLQHRQVV